MTNEMTTQRYAQDWNSYSATWDQQYGGRYNHLGDEWCDDGTAVRAHEQRVMALAEPWLRPDARAVEIGPGGGKWTTRLAPRVGHLVVFDVADAMLARTRERCAAAGLTNVSFALGTGGATGGATGGGLTGVEDESIDLVFSYDVFVHIALEDTVAYVDEFQRVLKPGGVAVIHHALSDTAAATDRIESHNDWYRTGATLGQYYYHGMPALRRCYERAGLQIVDAWESHCTVTITVRKMADSIVPRLERAFRHAAVARTPEALQAAVTDIEGALVEAQARLEPLAAALDGTQPGLRRYAVLQQMRRLIRG